MTRPGHGMILQGVNGEMKNDGSTDIVHGRCGYQTSLMGISAGTISEPDASRQRRKEIGSKALHPRNTCTCWEVDEVLSATQRHSVRTTGAYVVVSTYSIDLLFIDCLSNVEVRDSRRESHARLLVA